MYISKIRVKNYKAFYDSDWIEFKPGINIISGQNNSGKTALLESLSISFPNLPHRSLKTLPNISSKITHYSEIEIAVILSQKEKAELISELNQEIYLPMPSRDQTEKVCSVITQWIEISSDIEVFISYPHQDLDFNIHSKGEKYRLKYLALGIYEPSGVNQVSDQKQLMTAFFRYNSHRTIVRSNSSSLVTNTFVPQLFEKLKSRIYRFYAERLNIGKCNFGDQEHLASNASNLAEVIHNLQSRNPAKFNRFNDLVSIVLPYIKRISVLPRGKQQLEIMLWSVEPETERDDLCVSLINSGTGVGQVLAILYVVVTSQEPRTIIIDEPQSFLHPGAARKLIEILQDFPQHQYFISTHSPSIIAAANPSTITLLKYQDSEATPLSISSDDTDDMRSLLDEVGVHLSDVFGSDNILWVEGPTEERCFPMILRQIAKAPLRGTEILALKNTGDLEGRKSEIFFDIYDRLSGGKALLPPAVGFILDSENKLEQDITDLKKRSGDKLHFLDRRMYENYLLDAEAITSIVNQYNFRDEPIKLSEIEQWISNKKQEWIDKQDDLTDDDWLKKVHAAKFLQNLFRHFSDKPVDYKKTDHSVELTKWLVQNKPQQLQDIADLLNSVLGRSPEE